MANNNRMKKKSKITTTTKASRQQTHTIGDCGGGDGEQKELGIDHIRKK